MTTQAKPDLPPNAKGGSIWYWVCQGCGVYKARPSRTNLYCSLCQHVINRALGQGP